MADSGMTFEEMEKCYLAMLSEKSFVATAPTDEDLHRISKTVGFGERYGATQKSLATLAKELGELVGPSPDKQDAVASACFVLDSLSALEKKDVKKNP